MVLGTVFDDKYPLVGHSVTKSLTLTPRLHGLQGYRPALDTSCGNCF